ncbi:cadherin-17 [Engystomops pustulosus]|uniref:cadherin-17 n=1 Tax=Engystomops pustulosus TaxID=76066 RepID=UPI003AFB0205
MRWFKMWTLKDFLILLCCIQTLLADRGPLTSKTFHVPEGTPGLQIYLFEQTDSRSVNFILEGNTDHTIYIQNDGWLGTREALDWEKRSVYSFKVKTVDSRGTVIEGPYDITVIVDDINNNAPSFNTSRYYGEVREQYRPGRPFIQVFATDRDDPSTPNAQLVYKIKQQIPDPTGVMFFKIDNVTGEISTTLEGSMNLKFGDKPYELVLEVSDLAERPFIDNAKVYITILENLWKAPKPVTILENSTSPHPYTITKVTWNDQSVIYELHQREKFPRFPFIIDQNGNINVTEPLDREERDQYIFYALAKNYNGVAVAKPLEIEVNVEDINDNPPVCPAELTIFEVQENEAIGSVIGVLKAMDMDQHDSPNSVLSYTLVEQWPDTSPGKLFRITLYNGDIQLINAGLNIQRDNQYRLKVDVSDEGNPSLSTMCWVAINVIDINDHIPIFESFDYGNVTLREDTPSQTLVKEIQATDDDEPNTGSSAIEYLILEGDPDKMFTIQTNPENNRGYVRVAASLDYEKYQEHNLVIAARNPEPLVTGISYNSSSVTHLKVIIIDVDEKPVFDNPIHQVQVLENITTGTFLKNISAFDPEGDKILFSLSGNKFNWLRINEETGEIFTNAPLDRERESHYVVEVIATESKNSKLSSNVSLHLYLDDVNDNFPELAKDYYSDFFFCHPLRKPESVVFSGVDADRPSWGTSLRFRLGGNESTLRDWNIQYVNATSARLTMLHADFPKGVINVPIIIRDNGRPALESSVSVPVRLCTCDSDNRCEKTPLKTPGLTTVGMALGILFGTLAVIGIILAAVFISMNKNKKKAARAGPANNASETATLRA